jgi:hypothetical protein
MGQLRGKHIVGRHSFAGVFPDQIKVVGPIKIFLKDLNSRKGRDHICTREWLFLPANRE